MIILAKKKNKRSPYLSSLFILSVCVIMALVNITYNSLNSVSDDRNNDSHNHQMEFYDSFFSPMIQIQQTEYTFPIWGTNRNNQNNNDNKGIDFKPILAYIKLYEETQEETQSKFIKHNILYPKHLFPHYFESPNVMYVFGQGGSNSHPIRLWVDDNSRRSLKQFMRNDRHVPIEVLLKDSILYLFSNNNIQNQSKWVRLKEVSETTGVPLLLDLDDHRYCSENNLYYNTKSYSLPIFTTCAANPSIGYCNYSFPLPTYSTVELVKAIQEAKMNTLSPSSLFLSFEEQDKQYPWSNKVPSIIWRGTYSGNIPISILPFKFNMNRTTPAPNHQKWNYQDGFTTHPIRFQMVNMAMEARKRELQNDTSLSTNWTMFDIYFGEGSEIGLKSRWRSATKLLPAVRPKVMPMHAFQKYKAVADVDGNSWSERFAKLLCMNSVVVKVEPEFVDYFHPQVKPWVHYIPLIMNSSNLWEIGQYIVDPKNDAQLQQIVSNARQWCQNNMKYEKLIEYVLDSLSYYVHMLDIGTNRTWTDQWSKLHKEKPNCFDWKSL